MSEPTSRAWIESRLADYKACRSHREVTAIESMIAQIRAMDSATEQNDADVIKRRGVRIAELEARLAEAVGLNAWIGIEPSTGPVVKMSMAQFDALLAVANAAADLFGSEQAGDPSPHEEPLVNALNVLWDQHPSWREWKKGEPGHADR
jgi:hypothetical protein